MTWQSGEGMKEYLKPTKMCDSDNVQLREKAKDIIKGAETPKEAALRIFYYTRDQIRFGLDYPDKKASQTLKKRMGFCITKCNLQIALLRTIDIPARCHYVHLTKESLKALTPFCITKCNLQIALLRTIDIPARCHYVHLTKESLKALTPRFMYNKLPEAIVHIWCECYLSGNWLACEALLDEEYYKGLLKMGAFTSEQVPTIDWDGETNLILVKHRVVKDIDTFSSWDDAMSEGLKRGDEMPMTNRVLGWLFFSIVNRRVQTIRTG